MGCDLATVMCKALVEGKFNCDVFFVLGTVELYGFIRDILAIYRVSLSPISLMANITYHLPSIDCQDCPRYVMLCGIECWGFIVRSA